jgi:serine protease Do
MYFTKQHVRLAALCLLPMAGMIAAPVFKEGTRNNSVIRQLSKESAAIAKKATPAVVSIRSQFTSKHSSRSDDWDEQQMNPYQDEFWQRFFGMPLPKPERKSPKTGLGSGFFISADGFLLTNNHVIENAEQITVVLNNEEEYIAKVIGTDPNTDIALLKVEAKDLPFLVLGNSDELEVGEWVMAIGNSLGLQATCTTGVVSANERADVGIAPVESFIQTDAAINRGNSGGCLLNIDGEAIGMNTAIASSTGGYMGIGFAIPSNLIKPIVEQLRTTGHVVRGYLGVSLQKIDAKLAQSFGLERSEGALISEVVKDSPADKAGLKSGDVVLKVNSKPITIAGKLRNIIAFMKPGEPVTLTIMRNKKEMQIKAIVGTHPETELAASDVQSKLGFMVQDLTADLAQQMGYESEKGVLIRYVDPESHAHELGLKRGQLILSVNQIPVSNADEFYKLVQQNASNKRILLQLRAGQVVRYITIDLH